jgi:ABC-type nitrate/sulfonate/bicarbonate transport system substrate-binding protein
MFRFCAATFLFLTAFAVPAFAADKVLPLTVAVPFPVKPPICCMAVPAAQDLGYYKRAGLDVKIINVGTASTGTIQMLVAGRTDVATASIASGLGAYVAGANDVRFIGAELNAIYTINKLKWTFAAKDTIKTVADLKGKTIGIPAGPNPTDPVYVQIGALLKSAGMNDRDVRWTVAGAPSARVQALTAGRIDFTQMPMEMSYFVTPDKGLHLLAFDPAGANNGWNGCQCWFTSTKTLADPEKREAVQRFVEATALAVRDMARDKTVFLKAMGMYVDMSVQTPKSIDDTFNYYRLQYTSNGGINFEYMNAWLNDVYLAAVNPAAKGKVTLKQVSDPTFVKAFLDKNGVDKEAYWDPPQLTPPG